MPQITLSVEHQLSIDTARQRLDKVVNGISSQFGTMITSVAWSPDRNVVKLSGAGFGIDLAVDERAVHLSADMTGLAGLLTSPLLMALKQIVQQTFQKRLH